MVQNKKNRLIMTVDFFCPYNQPSQHGGISLLHKTLCLLYLTDKRECDTLKQDIVSIIPDRQKKM